MAILDDIRALAKSIEEKAVELIAVGTLKSRIGTEKAAVEAALSELGERSYRRYQAGEVMEPGEIAICERIRAAHAAIADIEAQIEGVRKGTDQESGME